MTENKTKLLHNLDRPQWLERLLVNYKFFDENDCSGISLIPVLANEAICREALKIYDSYKVMSPDRLMAIDKAFRGDFSEDHIGVVAEMQAQPELYSHLEYLAS